MNIHYPFLLSKKTWKILGARNANTTTPPHHHCRHRMPWQLHQHSGPEPQTLWAMCEVEAEVGLGTRKMGRQQIRVRRADETGGVATKTQHAGMHFVNKPWDSTTIGMQSTKYRDLAATNMRNTQYIALDSQQLYITTDNCGNLLWQTHTHNM